LKIHAPYALTFAILAFLITASSSAQPPPAPPILQEPQTILLWPNGAPGAQGTEDRDKPAITVYMPPNTTGPLTAVIVAPGGSYRALASNLEGRAPANYFNALGIAAFVLRYRLGPQYHHPIELGDAQRAIRTVRARAAEWHIAADRIGFMGFSAGGHLASTAATHFDVGGLKNDDNVEKESCRPDFAILAYPVISFEDAVTHKGSRTNLVGANPDASLLDMYSNEKRVTKETPPVFIFHTSADTAVLPENATRFYSACKKAGVPVELHIYEKGRHGVGLGRDPKWTGGEKSVETWPDRLADWMKSRGLLEVKK
jgi:acetyl esterase/lipase